jgi:hypothetical protein
MKIEQVQKALEGESGVKSEGKGTYVIADEVELTVLLDMGQEPLSVGRIRRLVIQPDLLTLETQKGERVYTSAPVRALKLSVSDPGKLRGAGFTSPR